MHKYFTINGIKVLELNTESDINTWRSGRFSKYKSVKYHDAEPSAQISRVNFSAYLGGASFISLQFLDYSLANNLKEKLHFLNLEYLDTAEQIEKVIIRFAKDSHKKILDMLSITAQEYPTFKAIHAEFAGLILSTLKIDELHSIIDSSGQDHTCLYK